MGLLDRLAPRKNEPDARPQGAATDSVDDPVFSTKALRKFLSCLTSRESPVLLDLGPVVGSNVSFFGEQLGCKIFVEDIFADIDRHVRDNKLEDLPAFLKRRLTMSDGSVSFPCRSPLVQLRTQNSSPQCSPPLWARKRKPFQTTDSATRNLLSFRALARTGNAPR